MDAIMKRKITQIYSLVYNEIVTPYNMLDNIFIEGYTDIHYYKEALELVCKLVYKPSEIEDIYYYYFDKENKLQRVVNTVKGKETELFNRNDELDKSIKLYTKLKDIKEGENSEALQ